VQLGAHVSTAGGIHTAIDRIEAFGGDAVQVFTQSPRAWRPTNHDPATFERFKERRAEAGIGGVLCHALYLVNLASPDDEIYGKSVASILNTTEVACAIEADGVVFHVGSHLGAGLEAGLERAVPALERALGDDLAPDRELGGRRRDDRAVGGRACDPRRPPRPSSPPGGLPGLLPPLGVWRRRDRR
jgi:deoxyribonuclease-4